MKGRRKEEKIRKISAKSPHFFLLQIFRGFITPTIFKKVKFAFYFSFLEDKASFVELQVFASGVFSISVWEPSSHTGQESILLCRLRALCSGLGIRLLKTRRARITKNIVTVVRILHMPDLSSSPGSCLLGPRERYSFILDQDLAGFPKSVFCRSLCTPALSRA